MKLLTEKELIWSAVVANNRMNRERGASGVNSYENDLYFSPGKFLLKHLERHDPVRWLDLCCGKGNALVQCADDLARRGLQDRVLLKGIDLIDGFQPLPSHITCLKWQTGSVVDWITDEKFDLITCVHGLHYVGDKLHVIKMACKALTEQGRFIANIDLKNIKVRGGEARQQVNAILKKHGVRFDPRKKIVVCEGGREIDLALTYEGASDQAGPNYTGQEAVDSYYVQTGAGLDVDFL